MSSITECPWLVPPWEQAVHALQAHRMPTGVLIIGRRGTGRARLAQAIARARLCLEPEPDLSPCGRCAACRQMDAGAHPEFRRVEPQEGKTGILVDQVRELARELSLTAGEKGARCAVIAPADSLTDNASNALLKTLEEPPAGVSLILTAAAASRLLPTVASRCLRLPITAPKTWQARNWLRRACGERADWPLLLALSGGAPLAAARLAEEHGESLLPALDTLVAAASRRADPVGVAGDFAGWPLSRFATLVAWLAWAGARTRLAERPPASDFPNLEAFSGAAAHADARRLLAAWNEASEVANDAAVRNAALARERLVLLFVSAFESGERRRS